MCADTPETTTAPDYKSTLNLPKTDFPMRAGLPKREPEWLERWARLGVYDRLREKRGARLLLYMMVLLMRTGICTSGTR